MQPVLDRDRATRTIGCCLHRLDPPSIVTNRIEFIFLVFQVLSSLFSFPDRKSFFPMGIVVPSQVRCIIILTRFAMKQNGMYAYVC